MQGVVKVCTIAKHKTLLLYIKFAKAYPNFPILQVPLAEIRKLPIPQASLAELVKDGKEFLNVPLTQITWYHHISLLPKIKDAAKRALYIMVTAQEGWSRDVMLLQIANDYINAKGKSINNFEKTLPPVQSDLARYTFKDPYNFSFLGTIALQNELEIEKSLADKVTDFLLEMGRGFSFVGRQAGVTGERSSTGTKRMSTGTTETVLQPKYCNPPHQVLPSSHTETAVLRCKYYP
ncbi:MAG: DUF1016 family protein [Prevotella sp.]|nr:DUF1016 family protein [Prevotella sp.]